MEDTFNVEKVMRKRFINREVCSELKKSSHKKTENKFVRQVFYRSYIAAGIFLEMERLQS